MLENDPMGSEHPRGQTTTDISSNRTIPPRVRTQLPKKELVDLSRAMIQQGAKSLAYTSLLFRRTEREGSWLLYSWCRLCYDAIDQTDSKESALKKLQWLESQTRIALHTNEYLIHPAFEGLRLLNRQYGLPSVLALDLLQGLRLDIEGFRPQTIEDLGKYCYHVAGVVGVMMCYVVGVTDERAHAHAVAVANALKMTDIACDFEKDWKLDRVYVPLEWLRELAIDSDNFDQFRHAWPRLGNRLWKAAEARYEFGHKGLHYLPWRARLACRIAIHIHREIGVQARSMGVDAWDERVSVPLWKKIVISIWESAIQTLEAAIETVRPSKRH